MQTSKLWDTIFLNNASKRHFNTYDKENLERKYCTTISYILLLLSSPQA